MKFPILAMLATSPAHGYELKRELEQHFGAALPPLNTGQIYTSLARLERDGLVDADRVAQARARGRLRDPFVEGLLALRRQAVDALVGPAVLRHPIGVDQAVALQARQRGVDLAGVQRRQRGPEVLLELALELIAVGR